MSIIIEGQNTIMNASNEWSKRAPDERFESVEALHDDAMRDYNQSATRTIKNLEMVAKAVSNAVLLQGERGDALLNNWSFGQLALRANAPASYLRTLPPTLAAECINNGLLGAENDVAQLLLKRGVNGDLPTIAAMTSDKYSRIWDYEITQRLVDLKHSGKGWQEAPAAFDGSRGQYRGDRDMFSFFVDNDRRIFETGPNGGLSRGFFARNSQVGAAKFTLTTFWYEFVCGNHRIWGAKDIAELSIRHVGEARTKAFAHMTGKLVEYANKSSADDELKVLRAREYVLGETKDDILDTVLGIKNVGLSQKLIGKAFDTAVIEEAKYGNPKSAWGFTGGLTQVARDLPNADERVLIERAAGKILELAM